MDMIEVSAKTVNDAITEACQKLGVTSDKLDYEVVEEGSSGFLGIGAKPAVIKASVKKSSVEEVARVFLNDASCSRSVLCGGSDCCIFRFCQCAGGNSGQTCKNPLDPRPDKHRLCTHRIAHVHE